MSCQVFITFYDPYSENTLLYLIYYYIQFEFFMLHLVSVASYPVTVNCSEEYSFVFFMPFR